MHRDGIRQASRHASCHQGCASGRFAGEADIPQGPREGSQPTMTPAHRALIAGGGGLVGDRGSAIRVPADIGGSWRRVS